MGAWGPGIFSNDLAADAREDWRAALIAGEDPVAASRRIVGGHADEREEVEFWTGLAAAQHETGHLQPAVRDRALAMIEAGADLDLWEDAGQAGARRRALERLAGRLRGPQPRPKKLRGPRPGPDPGVEVGDVLRIRSRDGKRAALFCVVGMEEARRARHPVVLGLFTEDDDAPGDLGALPYLSAAGEEGPDDLALVDAPLLWCCLVARPGDEFGPDVGEVVARGIAPSCPDDVPSTYASFAALVELVSSDELDRCREATRRRLDGRGDLARADFARRSAMARDFWREQLRRTLDAEPDLEGLSPREVELLAQMRAGARRILDDS